MIRDIKVCLLGESGVGKTCLLHRFIHNEFCEHMSTIGSAYVSHSIPHADVPSGVPMSIWDTAGMEVFKAITRQYIRGSDITLICFDSDRRSFLAAENWADEVAAEEPNSTQIMVATKMDLVSTMAPHIPQQEVKSVMKKKGLAHVFNTSAKTGLNVSELFSTVDQIAVEKFIQKHPRHFSTVHVEGAVSVRAMSCCS
ncbi:hypothetical protein P9112_003599 [Eukaryota sp. TZLM1-RC]